MNHALRRQFDQLETAMDTIRKNVSAATEPNQKRATIFVLKVDQFVHF